jgi:uncharacterized membrane protein HdeD (DUF308 family)
MSELDVRKLETNLEAEAAGVKNRFAREDAVALLGLISLVIGIYLIYKPAALIALGTLLLVYAFVLGVKHNGQSQTGREG